MVAPLSSEPVIDYWRELRAKAVAESWAERGELEPHRPEATLVAVVTCAHCAGRVELMASGRDQAGEGVRVFTCGSCHCRTVARVTVARVSA